MGLSLSELHHWHLNARIAINTPTENITASLYWKKKHQQFDFLISGAFGITYAHLIQEKNHASLEIHDKDKLIHTDANQLLQESLGWDFPIHSLSYWVKGLPSGHADEQLSYNKKNQLSKITSGLWQIHFSKYQYFQGYSLPKMIKVNHPDIQLKIVAKQWTFWE